MIRNDYIMQMIQQIGVLVARIMNKNISREAMTAEFNGLAGQWIGLPVNILLSLPKEHVYELFEDSDRMVVEKSYLMAEISHAHGVVAESKEERLDFFASAMFFYRKCSGLVDEPIQKEVDERMNELTIALDSEAE